MQEGISWLDSLQTRGIRPGLENIRRLMAALGNPQDSLRIIHVAGSDGKGSVCCLLESIMMQSELNVGLFNSPHILKINEYIRINGKDIDDDTLNEILLKVKGASESSGTECTNFEALTAASFLTFSEMDVDIAIVEVGMGGRLDSTNIVRPEVTVINNVSLEHTAFLGDTIEKIASEKAGIMKHCVPCITINDGDALRVIEERASEVECPLISIDSNNIKIVSNSENGLVFEYMGNGYTVGLPGSFQARNAAVAIETAHALKCDHISDETVSEGLKKAHWPYRMEKLKDYPIILDVTHTKKGAEYLKKDIAEIYGKVTLVTAMLDDKDLDGVAKLLSEIAVRVYVSSPNSPRAASSERLAGHYRKYHNDVTVYPTVEDAIDAALKNDGMILVTGSFRTAEDCLRWLRRM